eukprot:jgi/Mesen1/10743/ME000901S10098
MHVTDCRSLFGAGSTGGGLFGSSSPAFGAASSAAAPSAGGGLFGSTGATPSLFGATPAAAAGSSSSSPYGGGAFGSFGMTPTPVPSFGQSFSTPFGGAAQTPPSLFGMGPSSSSFAMVTQMAGMAPLAVVPLPDRELQALLSAYTEEPSNAAYQFRYLFLSVTPPEARVKPAGVSELMWSEALRRLEGLEGSERAVLWPEPAQGFKDLSNRLRLQDEALAADAERLRSTESNVRALLSHFAADTEPWLERLRVRDHDLQRRLLRAMHIVEGLEKKGLRIPLTSEEVRLAERIRSLFRQLRAPTAELPRRVDALLATARLKNGSGIETGLTFAGSSKIEDRSLEEMQQVLQQQSEAIARLSSVLRRDARDLDIMMSNSDGGGVVDPRSSKAITGLTPPRGFPGVATPYR